MRGEGRDHGGLGLRSGGEGIGLRMEAWLKEKENGHDTKIAQEEEGSKHSTSYIKTKRTITKMVAA